MPRKQPRNMLQLGTIKIHILPKKYSKCYKIKITNSKKYNKQLNLTKPIKNELF